MTAQLRALLDDLEAAWTRLVEPEDLKKRLWPGADDEELASAEEEFGHALTSEARTLYAWHSGVFGEGWGIPLSPTVHGLGMAVSETLALRPATGGGGDDPFADVVVDWTRATVWATDGGSGRWWLTHEDPEVSRVVRYSDGEQGPSMPSIASVIELQLESLATGRWRRTERGSWAVSFESQTPTARVFGWF